MCVCGCVCVRGCVREWLQQQQSDEKHQNHATSRDNEADLS